MSHPKAYILGSGSFGSRAFSFLQRQFQTADILVVDHRSGPLERILADGSRAIVMDAFHYHSA